MTEPDHPDVGGAQGPATDPARTLALKAVGLAFGLILLLICAFSVEHLADWSARFGSVIVFLVFMLVMLVASQFTVGGASAIWRAIRRTDDGG